ncbi:hypothetical protein AWF62_23475 [Escherichia coli]|nr:hypothetical protein AWF62_23475 [Escherichia coli]
MTSLKTSIKTITYLSDIGCLEIQGASLVIFSPQHKTTRKQSVPSLLSLIWNAPNLSLIKVTHTGKLLKL